MKAKILPQILGKNNDYLEKYPVLGHGGFSVVYDLFDYDNLVLKHSYIPYDGFRYLAELSSFKRKKIAFVEIQEKKSFGEDVYYLLQKLEKINFNEKEKKCLDMINKSFEHTDAIMPGEYPSLRMQFIIEKVNILSDLLKGQNYEMDINEDNIMSDKQGNIYLTDPVAEMQ